MNVTINLNDLSGQIVHPSVTPYIFQKQDPGELRICEKILRPSHTVHEVAADGAIMDSKIAGASYHVLKLSVEQTSSLHQWLLNWHGVILSGPRSERDKTKASLRNDVANVAYTLTGISPMDSSNAYQVKSKNSVLWEFIVQDVQ